MTKLQFDNDKNLIDEDGNIRYLAETMDNQLEAMLIMKAYNEFGATSYLEAVEAIPQLRAYRMPVKVSIEVLNITPGSAESMVLEEIKSNLEVMGNEITSSGATMTYEIFVGRNLIASK